MDKLNKKIDKMNMKFGNSNSQQMNAVRESNTIDDSEIIKIKEDIENIKSMNK